MALPQPPDESSESSFWAAVYDEDPPHILCGVLTDLNLHRFTLHQHLTTNAAPTETPLLHQTFQDALPPAIQRLRNYNTNLYLANVHLHRALDALDAMGRHPPSIYLRNPDTATTILLHPPSLSLLFPPSTLSPGQPVALPPAIQHYLPLFHLEHGSSSTIPHRPLQHTSPPTPFSKQTSSLPHH